MAISVKSASHLLAQIQKAHGDLSVAAIRSRQKAIGKVMGAPCLKDVTLRSHCFEHFEGCWILPKESRRSGVILYLHGGGFVAGDLQYVSGFGSRLAERYGCRVFAPLYRLAPEHPFPAALEDALNAYRYLLNKGYKANQILLCGDGAGAGLCYSLCLQLKSETLPLPCGIVAVSPWVDLSRVPEGSDGALEPKWLAFCANAYTQTPDSPLVSPLRSDLHDLPASLIIGGDGLLTGKALYDALISHGCDARLHTEQDRWHNYLLYDLEENRQALAAIDQFLTQVLGPERKLRWMRLDNAAKIYPAATRRKWSSVFRMSATLTEQVDLQALQDALDITVQRFPSICARLRKGFFWYYLEQIPHSPEVLPEGSCPVTNMTKKEVSKCAFRVFVYEKRIAVEFFHSLTDGTGGMIFLKTLVAEYLHQKHGLHIPAGDGILGRLDEPSEEELEDSFQHHAGAVSASRKESTAWKITGTPEADGHRNLICLRLKTREVLEVSHRYGVSATAFLGAAMLQALMNLQKEKVPLLRLRKPVKVQIPVNLRRLFPSSTLRNFALYVNPEIDPRLGDFSFDEICKRVHHHMGMEVIPQHMRARIAANVGSERLMIVKLLPLFIKNIALRFAFNLVGERKVCLALSNLGAVKLPENMAPYVERLDFILGSPALTPINCGVVSYGEYMNINFTSKIQESELEYHFFKVLQQLGLQAIAESNLSSHP